MKRKPFAIFIAVLGLMLVGLAVFAHRLGIDNNIEWGRGRIVLFIIGFCSLLAGVFSLFELQRYLGSGRIRENPDGLFAIQRLKNYFFLLPVVGLVLVVYIWFASLGLWTRWPARTEYYSLLARAFQNHELHLPLAPSEKLLALPDPYDPSQRVGVGEPLDVSLYRGKFYLYWGPVPALILAAFTWDLSGDIPDLYLVFGFSCGLFLLQTILLVAVWDRYFAGLPKWILFMAISVVGLSAPSTWILGRASIYEAAIAGGQFFLLAGFLTSLSALNQTSPSGVRLVLAGSFWALAVGARLTLIVPIGFMMLMVAYHLWINRFTQFRNFVQKILCLGLPLLFGLILLAWYNWARFGSFSETGFSYALAGTYIQKYADDMMSHRYIIQNFFNYFLAPFHVNDRFPFIHSNPGSTKAILPFYTLPAFYGTNPITGLVYVVPFMFFSFIAVRSSISRETLLSAKDVDTDQNLLRWIVLTLSGSSLLALAFLLIFFWAAMRYAEDFLPMLLIVSVIGFCQIYIAIKDTNKKRYVAVAGFVLAGISIAMSTILGVADSIVFFREANPGLLEWFRMLFS